MMLGCLRASSACLSAGLSDIEKMDVIASPEVVAKRRPRALGGHGNLVLLMM